MIDLSATTVTGLAAMADRCAPAGHALHLRIGDLSVTVRTNLPGLQHRLRDYFREFLIPAREMTGEPSLTVTAHEMPRLPRPVLSAGEIGGWREKQPDLGKRRVKEWWKDAPDGRLVYKTLTGLVFAFGNGRHLAVGPCLRNDNQIVNFINNRYLEHQINRGALLAHAAAITYAGGALALAGFSGMGKSTLALHLMRRSADFTSNDRVLILPRPGDTAGPLCLGIPKQPRVNPGTVGSIPELTCLMSEDERAALTRMPPDELWALERKYDAPIDRCFGPGRFVLQAPLRAVVILNWRRDRTAPVIRPFVGAERPDLLGAFMKSTGLFYLPDDPRRTGDPDAASYVEALSRTPLFEITGGVDFDAAADALKYYLKNGDLPPGADGTAWEETARGAVPGPETAEQTGVSDADGEL